jgi:adenine-specific DNA-methyltransferase
MTRYLVQRAVYRGVERDEACRAALLQVQGIEIDADLAAISGRLLAKMLLREHGFVVPEGEGAVSVADALLVPRTTSYDLIIGNPPFGRVRGRLDPATLAQAGRANMGGHTNIYSLFLLRALDALSRVGDWFLFCQLVLSQVPTSLAYVKRYWIVPICCGSICTSSETICSSTPFRMFVS